MTDHTPASGPPGWRAVSAAWMVHAFTASGVVLAVLAMAAVERGRWREALLWLFATLIIDGIDGTLARAAHVKTRAPRVDGEVLDLVIDYLTYVFVPTFLMWRAGFLPEHLALPLAALIQLSSLYIFSRRDMKTDDGYFRGFPALWNVVALYFFVSAPAPSAAAAVVVVLALLSFAPIHVVHPLRVRDYGWWLLPLSGIWAAATAALLVPGLEPAIQRVLLYLSLASAAILMLLGLLRSFSGPRAA